MRCCSAPTCLPACVMVMWLTQLHTTGIRSLTWMESQATSLPLRTQRTIDRWITINLFIKISPYYSLEFTHHSTLRSLSRLLYLSLKSPRLSLWLYLIHSFDKCTKSILFVTFNGLIIGGQQHGHGVCAIRRLVAQCNFATRLRVALKCILW